MRYIAMQFIHDERLAELHNGHLLFLLSVSLLLLSN